jgi:hypothetical protein
MGGDDLALIKLATKMPARQRPAARALDGGAYLAPMVNL